MLKCYDCGIEVPANCGVRRSVETGSSAGPLSSVNYENVFLCAPCAVKRQEANTRVYKLWAIVSGALIAIYFLGSLLG